MWEQTKHHAMLQCPKKYDATLWSLAPAQLEVFKYFFDDYVSFLMLYKGANAFWVVIIFSSKVWQRTSREVEKVYRQRAMLIGHSD